jgi:3-oxoacyl-[acyl-carrier protein] reductase
VSARPSQSGPAPLAGRVAVVTGGSSGLGLAIARSLYSAGAQVVATSRHAPDSDVDGVTWHHSDVTDSQSVGALFHLIASTHGRVDIAVANAGVSKSARLMEMCDSDWQATIDTNLTGTFNTIRAAAKLMQPRRQGRIVTVSSCMASLPAVGTSAYAASKSAIEALTKATAVELAPHGILTNCVAPGILDEGMGATVSSVPRLWDRYRDHLAMGRLGRVEEVARVVAFLAGPDATYVNGATISIDGGLAPWT